MLDFVFYCTENGTSSLCKCANLYTSVNCEILVEYASLYFALFVCVFAIIAYFYKVLRKPWTVQVNCWFCNKDSITKFENENSFVCPFCHQYNGFDENGGYNKVIPAQHMIPSDLSGYRFADNQSVSSFGKSSNGLCDSCNFNQSLKVRTLAEFSWSSSAGNEEIDRYRNQLEELYTLCRQCQAFTNQTLGKQDFQLKQKMIAWKLIQSNNKSTKIRNKDYKYSKWTCLQLFSLLLNICLIILSVVELISINLSEKRFMKTDVFYSSLISMQLICGILYFFVPKLGVKVGLLTTSGVTPLVFMAYFRFMENNQSFILIEVLLCVLNALVALYCYKISSIIVLQPENKIKSFKISVNKKEQINTTLDTSNFESDSIYSSPPNSVCSSGIQREMSDLDSDLLSLKIGTPKKYCQTNVSSYNPENPFLNCLKNQQSSDKNILRPSKFGRSSITQSSWVAGGYWGSPVKSQRGRQLRQIVQLDESPKIPLEPLFSRSRSSSQSSGFVSQLSDQASSHSVPKFLSNEKSVAASTCSCEKPNVFNVSRNESTHDRCLDNWEILSSRTASSAQSTNSQLRPRFSYVNGQYMWMYDSMNLNCSREMPETSFPHFSPKSESNFSYLNVGIAFILGLSISTNLFLVISLLKYSV